MNWELETGKWSRPSLSGVHPHVCSESFGLLLLSIFLSSTSLSLSFHPCLLSFSAFESPLKEKKMSLRQETRWHKHLSWLIVFWNGERAIVRTGYSDDVRNWKTEHGLLNMFGRLEAFGVSTSSSNSLFSWLSHSTWLIVPMKSRNCNAY